MSKREGTTDKDYLEKGKGDMQQVGENNRGIKLGMGQPEFVIIFTSGSTRKTKALCKITLQSLSTPILLGLYTSERFFFILFYYNFFFFLFC